MLSGLSSLLAARRAKLDTDTITSTGTGSSSTGGPHSIPSPRNPATAPHSGLINGGATCYLNSLIQALFSLPEFRAQLFGYTSGGGDVTTALRNLFAEMQCGNRGAYSTRALIASFGWSSGEQFTQHDASEALIVLLEALQRETLEGGGVETSSSQGLLLRYPGLLDHIQSVHTGTMVHAVTCSGCGGVTRRPDPFTTLVLPVKGHSDLHACIQALVAEEVMDGDNSYHCDACGGKRRATRCVRLESTPEVLLVHLNRYEYNLTTMSRKKVEDAIALPHLLDLSPYHFDSPGEGDHTFELTGALLHTGGAAGGHYFCHLKTRGLKGEGREGAVANPPPQPQWMTFNDERVSVLRGEKEVEKTVGGVDGVLLSESSKAAYMLVYLKKGSVSWDNLHSPGDASPISDERLPAFLPPSVKAMVEEGNRAYVASREAWEKAQRKLTLRVLYPGEAALKGKYLPLLLGDSQRGVSSNYTAPASPSATTTTTAPPSRDFVMVTVEDVNEACAKGVVVESEGYWAALHTLVLQATLRALLTRGCPEEAPTLLASQLWRDTTLLKALPLFRLVKQQASDADSPPSTTVLQFKTGDTLVLESREDASSPWPSRAAVKEEGVVSLVVHVYPSPLTEGGGLPIIDLSSPPSLHEGDMFTPFPPPIQLSFPGASGVTLGALRKKITSSLHLPVTSAPRVFSLYKEPTRDSGEFFTEYAGEESVCIPLGTTLHVDTSSTSSTSSTSTSASTSSPLVLAWERHVHTVAVTLCLPPCATGGGGEGVEVKKAVAVDIRCTLAQLRASISTLLGGLSDSSFRVHLESVGRAGSGGGGGGIGGLVGRGMLPPPTSSRELVGPTVLLMHAGVSMGCTLRVTLGRPLGVGEAYYRICLLAAPSSHLPQQAAISLIHLGTLPLPTQATVREAKEAIYASQTTSSGVGASGIPPLPPTTHFRLRECSPNGTKLTKVLLDCQPLGGVGGGLSNPPSPGTEPILVVQPVPEGGAEMGAEDLLITLARFHPEGEEGGESSWCRGGEEIAIKSTAPIANLLCHDPGYAKGGAGEGEPSSPSSPPLICKPLTYQLGEPKKLWGAKWVKGEGTVGDSPLKLKSGDTVVWVVGEDYHAALPSSPQSTTSSSSSSSMAEPAFKILSAAEKMAKTSAAAASAAAPASQPQC